MKWLDSEYGRCWLNSDDAQSWLKSYGRRLNSSKAGI